MSDSHPPSIVPALLVVCLLALGAAGYWLFRASATVVPAGTTTIPATAEETSRAGATREAVTRSESRDSSLPGRSEVETAPAPARMRTTADERREDAVARATGRVVDEGGQPIRGARVSMSEIPDADSLPFRIQGIDALANLGTDGVSTDANGRFDLGLPRAGEVTLAAWHDDHLPVRQTIQVSAGGHADEVVLVMAEGAAIAGRVVGIPADVGGLRVGVVDLGPARPGLGEVLGDAAGSFTGIDFSEVLGVLLDVVGERSVAVDPATGSFEVRGLVPEHRYRVWGFEPGAAPHEGTVTTRRLEATAGTRGLELAWQTNPVLVARVVDAATGAPLTELDVAAGLHRAMKLLGMSVDTTPVTPLRQREFAEGVVRIDHLTPRTDGDRATLEVRALGYREQRIEGIELPQTGTVDLGVVRLSRAPTVRVQVVRAADGAPVADAEVELLPVDEGGEDPSDRDAAETSGSISFRMSMDSESREGLPDFGQEQAPVRTDAEGYAELTCPEAEAVAVHVVHPDHAPRVVETGPLPRQGRVEVTCALSAGGAVEVLVVDRDGRPAPGYRVLRKPDPLDDLGVEGENLAGVCDEDGRVRFEHLPAGPHGFRVAEPDAEDGREAIRMMVEATGLGTVAWTTVEVTEGRRHELRLEVPRHASIEGRLTLDGEPLEGAMVRLLPAIEPDPAAGSGAEAEAAFEVAGDLMSAFGIEDGSATETDELGAFRIERLPLGRQRLTFRHRDLAAPVHREVDLVEGPNPVQVALLDTTVRGLATDAAGNPLDGATVQLVRDVPGAEQASQVGAEIRQLFSGLGIAGGSGTPECTTDAAGRFTIRGVPPGVPYRLLVSKRMHCTAGMPLGTLNPGDHRDDIRVTLVPGGRIRVGVDGEVTLSAVEASWAGPHGPEAPAPVTGLLKGGRCYLDGLRPGLWTVKLQKVDGPSEERNVEVVAGETVRIDF